MPSDSIPAALPEHSFGAGQNVLARWYKDDDRVEFDWPVIEAAAADPDAYDHALARLLVEARSQPVAAPVSTSIPPADPQPAPTDAPAEAPEDAPAEVPKEGDDAI